MKSQLIFQFFVFAVSFHVLRAPPGDDQTKKVGIPLRIEIVNLEVSRSNKTTKLELKLTNPTKTPIRFSGFELGSAIAGATLFDSKKCNWEFQRSAMISDLPVPNVDYKSVILPGKSFKDTHVTGLLRPTETQHVNEPNKITFHISDSLRVANPRLSRFWNDLLKGEGECDVKWK